MTEKTISVSEFFPKAKTFAKNSRWYKEVLSLMLTLSRHGYTPVVVDDSENFVETPDNLSAAAVICNLDECQLKIAHKDGHENWLRIVLDEPGYIVCDYWVNEITDKAVDEHYHRWNRD